MWILLIRFLHSRAFRSIASMVTWNIYGHWLFRVSLNVIISFYSCRTGGRLSFLAASLEMKFRPDQCSNQIYPEYLFIILTVIIIVDLTSQLLRCIQLGWFYVHHLCFLVAEICAVFDATMVTRTTTTLITRKDQLLSILSIFVGS